MKILILLSTYNGKKFINVLMDSLIKQNYKPLNILIRDDGSIDETITILEKYRPFFNFFKIIKGNNVGVTKSFLELLNHPITKNYDYFSLCDQDDYWIENKITIALENFTSNKNIPQLYYSSAQMYSSDLTKSIKTNFDHSKPSLLDAILRNRATGCTIVFNKALLCKFNLFILTDDTLHDHWLLIINLLINGITYVDKKSFIKYRQHSNNYVGGKKILIHRFKQNLNYFFRINKPKTKIFSILYNNLYHINKNNLKISVFNYQLINKFYNYYKFSKNKGFIMKQILMVNLNLQSKVNFIFACLFNKL